MVGHAGALGETVTVIVTGPGVDGQVNVGVALAALSKVPAVAVHAKLVGSVPADAVAESEIGTGLRRARDDDTALPRRRRRARKRETDRCDATGGDGEVCRVGAGPRT